MSRRRVKQDSLELLLDTICNTFGGVLFIAIMVVMLLQQTSQSPDAVDSTVTSPEELETRQREFAALSRELTRHREIKTSQAALLKSLVPDTLKTLADRRQELLAQQAQLQSIVDAQLALNAALAATVIRQQAQNEQIRADLKKAQQEVGEARTLLASEQKAKVQAARLPLQRQSGAKREVAFILRYGRLYLWHDYDLTLQRTGLNLRDFVILGDEDDELRTRPKVTAGIPLDGSPGTQAAIDQILRRFDPRRFYLGTVVRADSHGAFQFFRDRATALGFDYRMLPAESDTPISDRGGRSGRTSVQ